MRVREPDSARLRQLFVELEFHTLAALDRRRGGAQPSRPPALGAPERDRGDHAPDDELRHGRHDAGARAHDRARAEGAATSPSTPRR